MENLEIKVEHCPEIDDARFFEVEFKDDWNNAATLGLAVIGHAIFHDGVIIPVDMKQLKGDMEG